MVNVSDIRNEHPLLKALSPQHAAVVMPGAETLTFHAGQVLFREGEPACRLYLIREGRIALETHVPGHGDVLIATLGKEEILGWSWLIAPYVWHFQARALEPTQVLVLNGANLLAASERDAELGYALMVPISNVILQVLLAAHKRFAATGHRPVAVASKDAGPVLDIDQSVDQRVAAHPLLQGLPAAHLQFLQGLAKPVSFGIGQMVFQTGHPANCFYLLERGQVVLESPQPDGPVLVQVTHPGGALGWSSFFEPYLWHFDARVLEPAMTIAFDGNALRARCAADHHFGYEFMKRVTRTVLQRLQATRKRFWEALI